jgi:hypothetical protein
LPAFFTFLSAVAFSKFNRWSGMTLQTAEFFSRPYPFQLRFLETRQGAILRWKNTNHASNRDEQGVIQRIEMRAGPGRTFKDPRLRLGTRLLGPPGRSFNVNPTKINKIDNYY